MRELPMPPFIILGDFVVPSRPAPHRVEEKRDHSKSKSWSKSRGHKSHGRKHGKKDC
jgi:hypothetical protein